MSASIATEMGAEGARSRGGAGRSFTWRVSTSIEFGPSNGSTPVAIW